MVLLDSQIFSLVRKERNTFFVHSSLICPFIKFAINTHIYVHIDLCKYAYTDVHIHHTYIYTTFRNITYKTMKCIKKGKALHIKNSHKIFTRNPQNHLFTKTMHLKRNRLPRDRNGKISKMLVLNCLSINTKSRYKDTSSFSSLTGRALSFATFLILITSLALLVL